MKNKSNKGITLIALVVTIIILILLAGISIHLIFGQYGLMDRAKTAKEETRAGSVQDERNLWIADVEVAKATNQTYKSMDNILEELKNKGLLTAEEVNIIKADENNEITIASKTISFKIDGNNNPVEPEEQLPDWEYTTSDADHTILLTKYIGTNPEVTVHSTYTLNNKTYQTMMKKTVNDGVDQSHSVKVSGPFAHNNIITKVVFENNVSFEENSLYCAFYKCSALVTPPVIPSNITNMEGTFANCTALTTPPAIPSSVMNMEGTFSGCIALTTAPTISNNVTNMKQTFASCEALVTAPVIPNNVTNMEMTFVSCKRLITAPTIPSNVINMDQTFAGCSSLKGTIVINASNITSARNIVSGTYGFYETPVSNTHLTIKTPGPSSTTYQTIQNQNTSVMQFFTLQ